VRFHGGQGEYFGNRDFKLGGFDRPVQPLELQNSGNAVVRVTVMSRRLFGGGSTPFGIGELATSSQHVERAFKRVSARKGKYRIDAIGTNPACSVYEHGLALLHIQCVVDALERREAGGRNRAALLKIQSLW
jgi:hypothetical protein